MTAAYDVVPFSDLLHRPAVTAGLLDQVRAVRLRRRDAGDLALMRIEQLDAEGAVVDFTARLLAGLLRRIGAEAVRDVLPDAVPWVTFLPAADVDKFLTELVAVAQGAAALENLAPLAGLLTQWRHTAEVYADPVLLELVTNEPEGDFGPAPMPDPTERDR
ncbi:hypothetical protein ACIA8C_00215 [Nocardia sp. NPDC051321]|uniref:hypothetical protein n=1 Tax=Nocardia sp. NPDC051321 TaxID=3364323 RepID=UPI0037A0FFD5